MNAADHRGCAGVIASVITVRSSAGVMTYLCVEVLSDLRNLLDNRQSRSPGVESGLPVFESDFMADDMAKRREIDGKSLSVVAAWKQYLDLKT